MYMYKNYIIQAAISLNLVQEEPGIGLTDDFIKTPDGTVIEIDERIVKRAKYIYNLISVRQTRDKLLAETDWIAGSDVPDSDLKTQLMSYRQKLRDITDYVTEDNYSPIIWPHDPRFKRVYTE